MADNQPNLPEKEPDRKHDGSGLPSCTVEFGDDYNRVITIDSLQQAVRGAFSIRTLASRKEGARDVGQIMARMPDIPGMRLTLNFRARKYILFDPLTDDAQLLRRINAVVKEGSILSGSEYGPCDTQERQVEDQDEWKTLVDEMCRKRDGECLKVVEGKLPTPEQLKKMPGRRLNDPWNSSPRKPRYHDQQHDYALSLDVRG
jgi:hypothetical protein